jgi:molybdenum cofactor cytidylyltransferase/nicotine blue oxidoreductase
MVIAAGGGRRIGGPEALLRHDDTPLVDRAI